MPVQSIGPSYFRPPPGSANPPIFRKRARFPILIKKHYEWLPPIASVNRLRPHSDAPQPDA
jgi:hypothetical protein